MRRSSLKILLLAAACSADPSLESSTTDATTTETTDTPTDPTPSLCGDGIVDPGEQCDDANTDDHDACTNTCTLARCGDGIVGPGERCDDANDTDDDDCSNSCTTPCGDGIVQPGEDCDDAGLDTATCDADCTLPLCLDGRLNTAAGEQCDDAAETATCDPDCTLAACGDGHINVSADENCDDANQDGGDTCSRTCQPTVVVELVAGGEHTCIRLATGAVRCWGRGTYGQLGHGSTDNLGDDPGELPTIDLAAADAPFQLCTGARHTCTLSLTGARCWGWGALGALGLGDTDTRGDDPYELPTALATDFMLQLACGGRHTCVRTPLDGVRCWGSGPGLGRGDADTHATAGPDVPGLTNIAQLALGTDHTCAVHNTGDVSCWGANLSGELGHGTTISLGDDPNELPPPLTDLGAPVQQLAAGSAHTCALMQTGTIRCWGANTASQLGDPLHDGPRGDAPGEMPPPDVDLGAPAQQVVAGDTHTCALLRTGAVRCWGANNHGQLGLANTILLGDTPDDFPPPDVDLGGPALALAAHGGDHTCALMIDGAVRCWGRNSHGQLGLGHTDPIGDDEAPAAVPPVPY